MGSQLALLPPAQSKGQGMDSGHGTSIWDQQLPRPVAMTPWGIPTSRSSLATSLSSCKMPSSCPITIFIRFRILSLSQLLLLLLQLLLLGWSLGCLSWQVRVSILPYRPRFPAPTALSILLPPSRVAWRPRSPSRPGSFQHLNVPLPPGKSQPHARLPARSGAPVRSGELGCDAPYGVGNAAEKAQPVAVGRCGAAMG